LSFEKAIARLLSAKEQALSKRVYVVDSRIIDPLPRDRAQFLDKKAIVSE
jgi:hypothetical protein